MTDTHLSIDLSTVSKPDIYKLMVSTVMPRPIAWITTLDSEGVVNAAPYSFFNVVSSDPPIFAIGFSGAPDRDAKDTLANIRATGELVINLVPQELVEQMNITASDAPKGIDELQLAGLKTIPSLKVKPPRIEGSPVSHECNVFQLIETGGTSTILLARLLHLHVRRDVFSDESKFYIDASAMHLIGRMNGGGCYSSTKDLFVVPRVDFKDLKSEQEQNQ